MTTQEKQYLEKQQQLLQTFYKEFFTWGAEDRGMLLIAGFFEFIQFVLLCIPYQEMKESELTVTILYFGIIGPMLYLLPYMQFREGTKQIKIYEKLKYLPITLQGIRIFRLKKLSVFCLKTFVVFLAGQLFFSLVAFHEITMGNILYVVICGFLFPFGLNAVAWWFSK